MLRHATFRVLQHLTKTASLLSKSFQNRSRTLFHNYHNFTLVSIAVKHCLFLTSLVGGTVLLYKVKQKYYDQKSFPKIPFQPKSSLRDQFNFIDKVVKKCASSVVYIEIKDVKKFDLETGQPQTSSNGSGFLVSDDGLVLTNAHVVINKPKNLITVMLKDGTSYDATVENADMNIDLALLKIHSNRKFPYLRLGNSSDVTTGEWVIALGSPLSLSHSVTAGVISCIDRGAAELGLRNVAMRYLQTDAAITFGNSGGPLVNLDGDVIGINNLRVTAGIAFAIPVDYAKKFLQQSKMIKTPENVSYQQKQEKCVLGIITLLVTPELISLLDSVNKKVPNTVIHGVFVWKVLEDTPAYHAGLKTGDIITHINGRVILDTQNIYCTIEENTEKLTITIIRDGRQQEIVLNIK